MTTAYHPQADGLAERRNQTVETALRLAYIEDPNLDWKTLIPSLQWHLNTAYNTSTKTSAHELMYGFPLKGPLEAVDRTASAEADELPYIKEALRKQASLAMDLAAMKAKRWYDAKHRPIHLKAGDKVYLKLHQGYHQPGRPPKKWSQQREGPFVIRRMVGDLACELDLPEQIKVHPVISIHHLKPAHEGCFEEAHPGPVEVTKDFTDQEGEFYEVDKLLDVRVRKIGRNRKPVTEYLVHWKGWGSMHDQWVRKEEISSKALDEFHGQTTGPRVVRNSKAKGRSESSDM
ncbi:chromatin organization modifier domain-containing protein [Hirsutella rhossiliensis]|uniref:Chromo (CHRromatin organization MOdifier) domain-containing protein n=1 Tax=Hirsutella rhossiliensis TaxID=111463 RepID=A0A9P8N4F5_9HYPO|nr:chromo (CHRromatin organization MOdifier) domain-containing protein [Hirsutella rhossiliensis]KAH0966735.1 chromo (CHRromatin organization MOdifier) domain-containing protein [Hirsutella rhossiliensis]